ncbi:MAG: hypothetical protein WC073_12030 [Sterolibacterium sp.]
MSLDSILWGLSVAGFGYLGTYFLVKTLVKSGIEKAIELNFNKRLESEKTSLKKSEVYFTLQLEALSQLHTLVRKMLPGRSHPDMDWEDACEGIAQRFSKHEDALVEFLCRHEAVLPKAIAREIQGAASLAGDGTFQFSWNGKDAEPTYEAIKTAGEMYSQLEEAIKHLQAYVNSQVHGAE